MLLTHRGVSGPAVLDLSASLAECLAKNSAVTLDLAWRAGEDAAAWRSRFDKWRRTAGGTALAALLKELLPQRLAAWLCAFAGLPPGAVAAAVTSAQRDALAQALGAFPARITATEGWNKAMITRGGVVLREVDAKILESRLVAGLHFAGEMLDADGPCGGYNLHWALASGALAGRGGGE